MLAPRRGCLGYSKVYCDVRKRWFLAWNQNRHITYYIFHIQYTNSEISVGLLYIRLHFVWWHWLNHCAVFVRNLPTSILVRASVCLLTFHTSTILVPLWFTKFECWRRQGKYNTGIERLKTVGSEKTKMKKCMFHLDNR